RWLVNRSPDRRPIRWVAGDLWSSFIKDRQLGAFIGNKHGQQAGGLGWTGILADEMFAAGRLEKAFAGFVDLGRPSSRILGPNRSGEHVDEEAARMVMPG